MFEYIKKFEERISEFTGAPYVVSTDCCTHAIELCLILDNIKHCEFTAYTYLSVLQTMHKLKIKYTLIDEHWVGEYQFHKTRIWDSARRLEPKMYKKGNLQCLSFGHTKPVDISRGGAILLDNFDDYKFLCSLRYDGRDLDLTPWNQQTEFNQGFHYKLNPEECVQGIEKLSKYIDKQDYKPKKIVYPDCRKIKINENINMRR